MARHGRVARSVPIAVATVAMLSSCTSGGSTDVVRTARASCVDVPPGVLAHLASGAQPGVAFHPDKGAAVVARPGVFVIAARFRTASGKNSVGLWTAPALTVTSAPLLVADASASAVTTWGSVVEFPTYGVPLDDPALAAARRCLTR